MKKKLIISFFIIMFSIIQAPSTAAWNLNTHYEIVENNYNSMPIDVQQKLSLDDMKDGADDPDIKFLDFENHSYPNSMVKARYWSDKGKYNYEIGNYSYASYCFGVASHYISDSFCAPHTKDNTGIYHMIYELQGSFLTPRVTISAGSVYSSENHADLTGDLNSSMQLGYISGENNWDKWIKNKDGSYVQTNLNQAAGASYNSINRSILESNFN